MSCSPFLFIDSICRNVVRSNISYRIATCKQLHQAHQVKNRHIELLLDIEP